MKLILYSWNANNEQVLADNLMGQGFEIVWFKKECRHYTRDMELAMEMIAHIHEQGAEGVISFNYFPILSMICNTCQIPYYAWVYDSPHFTLYAKQISLPCNHIGIFDRDMVDQLESYGIGTVYHVPLSVDATYFQDVIDRASQGEREKYRCDISFVGSLYTDEHNYYELLASDGGHSDRTDRTECKTDSMDAVDDVIRRQCFSYSEDYLRRAAAAEEIDLLKLRGLMEQQGLTLGEDYFARTEDILLAAVLEKKVTVEERRQLLTELAVLGAASKEKEITDPGTRREDRANHIRNYDFRLYTGSDTRKMQELNACNYGMVDYHTQMPLVFAGSRINLNITLRSIHSGIPLRVLDIMACGGFVLSNRQPEITECFKEGAEIVTFGSLEECVDKVHYYLSHEEERRQIAEAGLRKVKHEFSYETGLGRLFGV